MKDVKRYGHISYLVEATPTMVQLYPSMTIYTLATDYDAALSKLAAETLRADTAEAELVSANSDKEAYAQNAIDLRKRAEAAEQRVFELESGRGEPVAWAVFTDKGNIRIWSSDCKAVGLRVEAEEGRSAVPLFTAPPAPVKIVLPSRKSEHYSEEDCDDEYPEHARGWNACLDATAALNGPTK